MWSGDEGRQFVVGTLAIVFVVVGTLIGLGLLFSHTGCIGVQLMHP